MTDEVWWVTDEVKGFLWHLLDDLKMKQMNMDQMSSSCERLKKWWGNLICDYLTSAFSVFWGDAQSMACHPDADLFSGPHDARDCCCHPVCRDISSCKVFFCTNEPRQSTVDIWTCGTWNNGPTSSSCLLLNHQSFCVRPAVYPRGREVYHMICPICKSFPNFSWDCWGRKQQQSSWQSGFI